MTATTLAVDDVWLTELCAAVAAGTEQQVWPIQPPFGIFEGRNPQPPYALAFPAGGKWDRAPFQAEHTCGWFDVQFRSVGRGLDVSGIADFLWLAARIRAYFDTVELAGSGWTATSPVESLGPPTDLPNDGTGKLFAVVETFRFYVQIGADGGMTINRPLVPAPDGGGGGGGSESPADDGFVFVQDVSATVWGPITHGLAYTPTVTVTDSNGVEFGCEVTYNNDGTVTVTCDLAGTGKVIFA